LSEIGAVLLVTILSWSAAVRSLMDGTVFCADGRPQLELLLPGGALGGAEIGALVGLLFGTLVGLGVGLRQQISDMKVFKVVEQVKPQPSQVAPMLRSPGLQPPVLHEVVYWTSPAAQNSAVGLRTGLGVGLGVGLRQQISDVKVFKVVEQVKPQPTQVAPT
jgi:hypothetical protein